MDTTHDSLRTGSGIGAALLAFAFFLSLLFGSYVFWHGGPAREFGTADALAGAGKASRLETTAFMRRAHEVSAASDFRRAEVVTIMGRNIIDLRAADIQGDEAVIENFVLMGHTQIRVPENWTVVSKGMVLMGGLHNRTRREGADPAKRLRLEGLVLMGAVTVSH